MRSLKSSWRKTLTVMMMQKSRKLQKSVKENTSTVHVLRFVLCWRIVCWRRLENETDYRIARLRERERSWGGGGAWEVGGFRYLKKEDILGKKVLSMRNITFQRNEARENCWVQVFCKSSLIYLSGQQDLHGNSKEEIIRMTKANQAFTISHWIWKL